jgi:DNA-directed RNA polymerase omega subunit
MIEETTDTTTNAAESSGTAASPLIDSRFMFVDVAALRAKQLRRGALPRVTPEHHDATHKLERVAMEEVRRGLIDYSVPELKKAVAPEV